MGRPVYLFCCASIRYRGNPYAPCVIVGVSFEAPANRAPKPAAYAASHFNRSKQTD
jgi:hypothetical protein